MSQAEIIIIGIVITTLAGILVWLLQSNFNDLKKRLDDISQRMVDQGVCNIRHRAIDDNIQRLFKYYNGKDTDHDR